MRREPRWLSRNLVLALHDALVREHGPLAGIRDEGLLDSALARPRNVYAHGRADLSALAAAYASGIVRDHPFLDGNKRTAFAAACVFLEDNGLRVELDEVEVVVRMVALAAGGLSERELAAWLEARAKKRQRRRRRS
jgi:death-on-curing protein